MKTILLPLYHGIRARNFFRTDTYDLLLHDQSVRLVIVIPSTKLEYYQKEFGRERVTFVPLDIGAEGAFGRALYTFAVNILPTDTIRLKHKMAYLRHRNTLKYWSWSAANRIFGPMPFVRPLVRFFDRFVPLNSEVEKTLKAHAPDLVIVPDIVFPIDVVFLRAAKRMGFPVLGMIRSWDNLTAKGVIQILPDRLIVHNDIMKEEAVRLAGMEPNDVVVTGPPQFDAHFQPRSLSREEFLRSLGIPIDRKIVLAAPFFNDDSRSAAAIVRRLVAGTHDGTLPANTHILVRYRPSNPELEEGAISPDEHLTITHPCSLLFKTNNPQMPTVDYEYTKEDVELLMNSLAYSDVVINTISTLSVDASAYDKPVINVRFDGDPATPARSSVTLWSGHDHYRALEQSGGVYLAKSMEDLVTAAREYLAHPERDRAGRARIIREQVQFTDGKSGERVASEILKMLRQEK